ncbi:MAG: GntR family transcriptional regulator [Lachnospiraceae bacterium]|nr:GntR family transcriptional regulator [Lachnospiraceae bacterium]
MLTVNFQSRTPVYIQLYENFIRMVSVGAIKPHDKLPPVRTLASNLGINPSTVQKAYKMLEEEGYIYSTVGSGSFVSDKLDNNEAAKQLARKELDEALSKAYKNGLSKEEMHQMVDNIERVEN